MLLLVAFQKYMHNLSLGTNSPTQISQYKDNLQMNPLVLNQPSDKHGMGRDGELRAARQSASSERI
jgi:hypothetical protein